MRRAYHERKRGQICKVFLEFKPVDAVVLLGGSGGGALGVITSTGAIEAALSNLVHKFKSDRSRSFIIAGIMFFFMFCSSTFGMGQEMMVFAPFIIVLMVSLGFNTVTAIGTMILGYAVGYGVGILNPFSLAVAQGIAGLPYTSGMGYRIAVSLVLYAAALIYVLRYAKRVHNNPASSLSPIVPAEFSSGSDEHIKLTGGHIRVWIVFFSRPCILDLTPKL